jgi:hypothetical protein
MELPTYVLKYNIKKGELSPQTLINFGGESKHLPYFLEKEIKKKGGNFSREEDAESEEENQEGGRKSKKSKEKEGSSQIFGLFGENAEERQLIKKIVKKREEEKDQKKIINSPILFNALSSFLEIRFSLATILGVEYDELFLFREKNGNIMPLDYQFNETKIIRFQKQLIPVNAYNLSGIISKRNEHDDYLGNLIEKRNIEIIDHSQFVLENIAKRGKDYFGKGLSEFTDFTENPYPIICCLTLKDYLEQVFLLYSETSREFYKNFYSNFILRFFPYISKEKFDMKFLLPFSSHYAKIFGESMNEQEYHKKFQEFYSNISVHNILSHKGKYHDEITDFFFRDKLFSLPISYELFKPKSYVFNATLIANKELGVIFKSDLIDIQSLFLNFELSRKFPLIMIKSERKENEKRVRFIDVKSLKNLTEKEQLKIQETINMKKMQKEPKIDNIYLWYEIESEHLVLIILNAKLKFTVYFSWKQENKMALSKLKNKIADLERDFVSLLNTRYSYTIIEKSLIPIDLNRHIITQLNTFLDMKNVVKINYKRLYDSFSLFKNIFIRISEMQTSESSFYATFLKSSISFKPADKSEVINTCQEISNFISTTPYDPDSFVNDVNIKIGGRTLKTNKGVRLQIINEKSTTVKIYNITNMSDFNNVYLFIIKAFWIYENIEFLLMKREELKKLTVLTTTEIDYVSSVPITRRKLLLESKFKELFNTLNPEEKKLKKGKFKYLKKSGKKPVDMMKELDPELFNYRVSSKYPPYSRLCQSKHQPLAFRDKAEMDHYLEKNPKVNITEYLLEYPSRTSPKETILYGCPYHRYKYPGFIEPSKHPKHIGMPCCRTKSSKDPKNKKNFGVFKLVMNEDKIQHISDEDEEKEEEIPKYIINFGKKLFPRRFGFLPLTINDVINLKEEHIDLKTIKSYYFMYGIHQDRSSFIRATLRATSPEEIDEGNFLSIFRSKIIANEDIFEKSSRIRKRFGTLGNFLEYYDDVVHNRGLSTSILSIKPKFLNENICFELAKYLNSTNRLIDIYILEANTNDIVDFVDMNYGEKSEEFIVIVKIFGTLYQPLFLWSSDKEEEEKEEGNSEKKERKKFIFRYDDNSSIGRMLRIILNRANKEDPQMISKEMINSFSLNLLEIVSLCDASPQGSGKKFIINCQIIDRNSYVIGVELALKGRKFYVSCSKSMIMKGIKVISVIDYIPTYPDFDTFKSFYLALSSDKYAFPPSIRAVFRNGVITDKNTPIILSLKKPIGKDIFPKIKYYDLELDPLKIERWIFSSSISPVLMLKEKQKLEEIQDKFNLMRMIKREIINFMNNEKNTMVRKKILNHIKEKNISIKSTANLIMIENIANKLNIEFNENDKLLFDSILSLFKFRKNVKFNEIFDKTHFDFDKMTSKKIEEIVNSDVDTYQQKHKLLEKIIDEILKKVIIIHQKGTKHPIKILSCSSSRDLESRYCHKGKIILTKKQYELFKKEILYIVIINNIEMIKLTRSSTRSFIYREEGLKPLEDFVNYLEEKGTSYDEYLHIDKK